MTDLIQTVLLYVCWIVVIVRVTALRSRNQRPLWFALLMLALGITMLQKDTNAFIRGITGDANFQYLVSSVMAVGVAATLLTFAARAAEVWISPWLRWISCGITVFVMITSYVVFTAGGGQARPHFFPVPGTLSILDLYWVVYLVYQGIATVATLVLLIKAFGRVRSWLVRTPVLLLIIGSVGFTVFIGSRFVAVFGGVESAVAFGTYVSSPHTIGVSLGCSIAAFVPLVLGWSAWRNANALYPLWKSLVTAVPHIALYPPRARLVDALLPQNSQLRLHRRLVEIRDGMLIMNDWVQPADLAQIEVFVSDVPPDLMTPITTACWLKVAIAVHAAGVPMATDPLDLVREGGTDGESELNWLRSVAAVWTDARTDRFATTVSETRLAAHRP
ncbi:MAB_1171c family putative transporter [Kutzneria chonburiensis]|uniref:MAB_1171c family putative transporter n=1 Tax=Kutzneria chonburiensis TaxID=1483604 RepID=A0ABV6MJL9_9PSEU|nr:MAB_1171c family putative transporter [Kutzneria chonburiensis]